MRTYRPTARNVLNRLTTRSKRVRINPVGNHVAKVNTMLVASKRIIAMALALAAAVGTNVATPNAAAAAVCDGTVRNYTVDNTGFLIISIDGPLSSYQLNYGRFCNFSAAYNGISTTMCQAIYSSVTAAYLSGRSIRFYTGSGTACSAISPGAGYAMVTGFHTWEMR